MVCVHFVRMIRLNSMSLTSHFLTHSNQTTLFEYQRKRKRFYEFKIITVVKFNINFDNSILTWTRWTWPFLLPKSIVRSNREWYWFAWWRWWWRSLIWKEIERKYTLNIHKWSSSSWMFHQNELVWIGYFSIFFFGWMNSKLTRLRLFGGERVTRFSITGGVTWRFFGGDRRTTEKFHWNELKSNGQIARQPICKID